jgi:cbb3-type cytochrome oxidase subunit 3
MTKEGMALLTLFAISSGICLWLYWRERNKRYALEAEIRLAAKGYKNERS